MCCPRSHQTPAKVRNNTLDDACLRFRWGISDLGLQVCALRNGNVYAPQRWGKTEQLLLATSPSWLSCLRFHQTPAYHEQFTELCDDVAEIFYRRLNAFISVICYHVLIRAHLLRVWVRDRAFHGRKRATAHSEQHGEGSSLLHVVETYRAASLQLLGLADQLMLVS